MKYVFTDRPVCSSRVDRRPERVKKRALARAEEKHLERQEIFSVEQLIQMEFYESKSKSRLYGVELETVRTEKIDADGYDIQTIESYQIIVCPPDNTSSVSIRKLNPYFWDDSECYCWKYEIYGNAMMWAALDLLSRIINFSCWDEVESVPLRWNVGNDNAYQKARSAIDKINQGLNPFCIPKPPKLKNLAQKAKLSISLRIPETKFKISNNALIGYLRHHWTPYDYLWQTGKMTRNDARGICNKLVRDVYPDLDK